MFAIFQSFFQTTLTINMRQVNETNKDDIKDGCGQPEEHVAKNQGEKSDCFNRSTNTCFYIVQNMHGPSQLRKNPCKSCHS